MITKEMTTYFKGVAILFVLIGHFVPPFLPFSEVYVPIKRLISQVGVDLFMFVSGYGIYVSYLTRNTSPVQYVRRRFMKIWPLYAVAITVYTIIQVNVFNIDIPVEQFIIHLLGLQVYYNSQELIYSASHFISAIFSAYILLVPALYVQDNRLRLKVVGVTFLVFGLLSFFLTGQVLFADYFVAFTFGIFLASAKKANTLSLTHALIISNGLWLFFDHYSLIKVIFFLASVLTLLITFPAVKKAEGLYKYLVVFGLYSYPIYLSHNYFVWKWPDILKSTASVTTTGCIIIIATMVWCTLFFYINSLLERLISRIL